MFIDRQFHSQFPGIEEAAQRVRAENLGPTPWAKAPDRSAESPAFLVKKYRNLVRSVAWQVFSRLSSAIELEDLTQIGMLAMVESAGCYEDRGDLSVQVYIRMRVRGAMVDALRRQAPLTRNSLRFRRQSAQARSKLETALGREPTEAEMSQSLSIEIDTFRNLSRQAVAPTFERIDTQQADRHACYRDERDDGFELLAKGRCRSDLAEAIAALPERENIVITQYFVNEMSLQEIGDKLNLGAPRVCQIKRAALQRLRDKLRGWSHN